MPSRGFHKAREGIPYYEHAQKYDFDSEERKTGFDKKYFVFFTAFRQISFAFSRQAYNSLDREFPLKNNFNSFANKDKRNPEIKEIFTCQDC